MNAVKGDMNRDVSKQYKAGYSGHVPMARDTFGIAHYGIGSHDSPDGYKKAGKLRRVAEGVWQSSHIASMPSSLPTAVEEDASAELPCCAAGWFRRGKMEKRSPADAK